jgi:hypothetical protein
MDSNAPQTARSGAAPGVRVPRLVPLFNPVAKVLLAAGTPMGPNRLITIGAGRAACLAPLPWRSSRSQAGGGSGPRGAMSTGCAICAQPAAQRSPYAAGTKTSVRPSSTPRSGSSSSATSLVRSRDASGSVSGSSAPSMVSISTIRWKLPRADVSSNSSTSLNDRKKDQAVRAPTSRRGRDRVDVGRFCWLDVG